MKAHRGRHQQIFGCNGRQRPPGVTLRKINNGFRSERGAALYADIRSGVEAARRRAICALQAIHVSLAGESTQPVAQTSDPERLPWSNELFRNTFIGSLSSGSRSRGSLLEQRVCNVVPVDIVHVLYRLAAADLSGGDFDIAEPGIWI